MLIREPTIEDLDGLHALVVASTGGQTSLNKQQLAESLFSRELIKQDKSLDSKLDTTKFHGHAAYAHCYLAEEDHKHKETCTVAKTLGYLIFHYYYTPWAGYSAFVDDVYVVPERRRQGIAKSLVTKLTDHCKASNMTRLLCLRDQLPSYLRSRVNAYRDENTDWSVIRIPVKL